MEAQKRKGVQDGSGGQRIGSKGLAVSGKTMHHTALQGPLLMQHMDLY